MSAALYIVLDGDDAGIETEMDGKAFSIEVETLAAIATEAGIAEPMHYVSVGNDELTALMDELGEDLGGANDLGTDAAGEIWIGPDEGCAWIAALQHAVEANATRVHRIEAVRADLTRLAVILGAAKKADVRWHLAVDY